jgi:hypothetical protein
LEDENLSMDLTILTTIEKVCAAIHKHRFRETSKQSNIMFSVRERLHGTTDSMNIIC